MSISIKPANRGLLHKKLGVSQGKPIALSSLMRAKQSSSPSLRKEANFALNARKWK